MRCHISDRDDEMNPPAYNIWTSGNLQTPNILKSILNPNASETNFSDELSNLCSLDSVPPSQKRKILDCEKEDFEERFHKIQRKKQLQKVAARANLVVDDDEEDSDDEDKIYEQMDWIEKENAINLRSYDSSSDEDDGPFDEKTNAPVLFIPRSKWKDERRRLLRISMAKIRCVDDPEAYLRRSVLINNTVKRLQKDIPINYRCQSLASTSFISGCVTYQNDTVNNWDASMICKQQIQSDSFEFGYQYSSVCNRDGFSSYPEGCGNMPCSLNFHLASTSASDKIIHSFQREVLHNDTSFCNRSSMDEQKMNDASLQSFVLKQPSPLHMFSPQPCGLQYRNPMHSEDSRDEYRESSHSGSSLLDSVVYHSLMASLET